MKQASLIEIVAARCWNVLNEGKSFTPVFVLGVFALVYGWGMSWPAFGLALLVNLPLFAVFYHFDYPLHLRWYLLLPLAGALFLFYVPIAGAAGDSAASWSGAGPLLLWALGLYAFFTVFFWGTLYYHLRIGTTWWNFTRIWKLFLKNSDSTSGNVFEQLPKSFVLLLCLYASYSQFAAYVAADGPGPYDLAIVHAAVAVAFGAIVGVYSRLVHKSLFNWKPVEYADYTQPVGTAHGSAGERAAPANRVVVIVIDGCRKERLEQADAPFLRHLRETGVYYDKMETMYPARTVVCFSSMFTGTYPREHGIKSNMVWKLGVRVESVFDTLRQEGRKGVLFGCAHLIDAFGDDVESFTAVEKNDVVDHKIMAQAKTIMKRENPELMVIQMIAVDQAGHSRGVLYPEYLEKIKESDALIEDFYRWMEREGYMENTTVVVMADHGQGNGIGGHGHLDVGERFVPLIVNGPAIRQGVTVREHRSIVSLAPTIAHLLGVPIPNRSRGPVLVEALRE